MDAKFNSELQIPTACWADLNLVSSRDLTKEQTAKYFYKIEDAIKAMLHNTMSVGQSCYAYVQWSLCKGLPRLYNVRIYLFYDLGKGKPEPSIQRFGPGGEAATQPIKTPPPPPPPPVIDPWALLAGTPFKRFDIVFQPMITRAIHQDKLQK